MPSKRGTGLRGAPRRAEHYRSNSKPRDAVAQQVLADVNADRDMPSALDNITSGLARLQDLLGKFKPTPAQLCTELLKLEGERIHNVRVQLENVLAKLRAAKYQDVPAFDALYAQLEFKPQPSDIAVVRTQLRGPHKNRWHSDRWP